MRAIAIEGFGGRDRLKLVDLPIPEPGPDDVLVRVRAAGVGPWDAKTREGLFGKHSRREAGPPDAPTMLLLHGLAPS